MSIVWWENIKAGSGTNKGTLCLHLNCLSEDFCGENDMEDDIGGGRRTEQKSGSSKAEGLSLFNFLFCIIIIIIIIIIISSIIILLLFLQLFVVTDMTTSRLATDIRPFGHLNQNP